MSVHQSPPGAFRGLLVDCEEGEKFAYQMVGLIFGVKARLTIGRGVAALKRQK
jgi:hypothetical protein